MSRSRGVDIWRGQGEHIDFGMLAMAGFDFIIAKATEGGHGFDMSVSSNVLRARAARLLVAGIYHVLTTQSDVATQAANALAVAKRLKTAVILDFEVHRPELWIPPITGDSQLARAVEFCARIEDAGIVCVVYTYPWFAKALPYGDKLLELVSRPLWIASYHDEKHQPTDDAQPTVPPPWTEWLFWQWSGDKGTAAPGINSVVDHDLFNGTRDELSAWINSVGGGT